MWNPKKCRLITVAGKRNPVNATVNNILYAKKTSTGWYGVHYEAGLQGLSCCWHCSGNMFVHTKVENPALARHEF